jgi:hypothetical protein
MKKMKHFLISHRTQTVLKIAGALLALFGLAVAGVAEEPIIFPG